MSLPSEALPQNLRLCPICAPGPQISDHGSGEQATSAVSNWRTYPLPSTHLVRSDCRPFIGSKMLFECQSCGLVQSQVELPSDYYAAYDLDEAQMGSEQCLFSPLFEQAEPRSRQLLHLISRSVALPKQGASLDLGCNHGFFSQELLRILPEWQGFGYEPWPRPSALRDKLIPAEQFFSGPLENVPGSYDLLSLIHVLEHLPDPLGYLMALPRLLNPEGLLLIQVPDYSQTAYDLTIFDHLWHFNLQTLMALLMQAGWEVVMLGRFLPKELTALCRIPDQAIGPIRPQCGPELESALRELNQLRLRVDTWEGAAKIYGGPRVVLGTAIAAGYVSGLLERPPDCYLDESPQTQGGLFWQRSVVGLDQLKGLPAGSLFLPFPPTQALRIQARLQTQLPLWQIGF